MNLKSIIRIAIWTLSAIITACAFAQQTETFTVYSQTTHACILTGCTDAQFTPAASLSYSFLFRTMGQKNVSGSVTWNGTQYADAVASMNWMGYGNHYPYGEWDVDYTFDGGINTGKEVFYCFRSCGTNSNKSGEVVIPNISADLLTGGGSGGGGSAHCVGPCGSKP